MNRRGKSLRFSPEEIEDLSNMEIKDGRIFGLLALLSPFIDLQYHQFHIDHVFPKSHFTKQRLLNAGVAAGKVDEFMDCANRIANLQLLDEVINKQKRATLPAKWIKDQYEDKKSQKQYCEKYFLGNVPDDVRGFLKFYTERRNRLQIHISKLVNSD